MHQADITRIAEQSKAKAACLEGRPIGYLILSALAGVYLGFGITLIFSVGAPFAAEEGDRSWRKKKLSSSYFQPRKLQVSPM